MSSPSNTLAVEPGLSHPKSSFYIAQANQQFHPGKSPRRCPSWVPLYSPPAKKNRMDASFFFPTASPPPKKKRTKGTGRLDNCGSSKKGSGTMSSISGVLLPHSPGEGEGHPENWGQLLNGRKKCSTSALDLRKFYVGQLVTKGTCFGQAVTSKRKTTTNSTG